MDISAAMDEAPVSKARTVTNLISVNNNQSNLFLNYVNHEPSKNYAEKSSVNLPMGALENSAVSID